MLTRMPPSKMVRPRHRPAGFGILAALLAAACTEQQFQLGFQTDTTAPTVAVALTSGDTLQVQGGIRFTVNAADNLGLKSVSVALSGGFNGTVDTTFASAVSQIALGVTITLPANTTAGGLIFITATAIDGNNNTATASDTLFLVNLAALNVTLVRPIPGAVTAAGKQVQVEVLATQSAGIRRVGYDVAGAFSAADSLGFALPDTAVFVDTLTVPSGVTGSFTITGFAVDSAGRRGGSASVVVTIQSVAADSTPPVVTFTVAKRVEMRDSITVSATDASGIILIGWQATDLAGNVLRGDSTTSSGALTDLTARYNLNFAFATLPQSAIILAFAVDAANNRGEARLDGTATGAVRRDTVLVVYGITRALPLGGRIADAIYSPNNPAGTSPEGEVYLTNFLRNTLEVFDVQDTAFVASISVGSEPWGVALWPLANTGTNDNFVVVANSGGTNLAIVNATTRLLQRKHPLPIFRVLSVASETDPLTGFVNPVYTEHFFSDRPQYIGTLCRTPGPPCEVVAVYSTTPTLGQTGQFQLRGSMRWEYLGTNPTAAPAPESHFFWEHAGAQAGNESDTLALFAKRGTVETRLLHENCGQLITVLELAFLDTTFVRNSGNFTRALVGEGGSSAAPALAFSRALTYDVAGGLNPTCTVTAGTFPLNQDLGVSPDVNVRDFISETAIPVRSVALNFNGLTNFIRADSVYVLDGSLRLQGKLNVRGINPGMDLNFVHDFDAGSATSGTGLTQNDRVAFVAGEGPEIFVYDTFLYGSVTSIPIRDPVIGPLRVARLAGGATQILVGVTAKGVVTVRLPAVTNPFLPARGNDR